MNKFASLKITEKTHKEIINYCKNNGLLIYAWVEKILLEEINRIKENNDGREKR